MEPLICSAILFAGSVFIYWRAESGRTSDRNEYKARIVEEWQRARAEVTLANQRADAAQELAIASQTEANRLLATMKVAKAVKPMVQQTLHRQNGFQKQQAPTVYAQDGMD